jgi:thiol-disulfide isomerase/thioredoxin
MKHFLVILCIASFLVSCSTHTSIEGQIESMPEQSFRLEHLAIDENVPVDSGKTDNQGRFSVKVNPTEEGLYRVRFEQGKYILLVLSPGDKAQIKGQWNTLENYTVNGSNGSSSLKGLLVNLRENVRDLSTFKVIMDSIKTHEKADSLMQEAENDIRAINKQFVDYVKNYADTTTSPSCALFAVNLINPKFEQEFIARFYKNAPARFPASQAIRTFSDRFNKQFETQKNTTLKPELGSLAPSFSGRTPENRLWVLDSFRGKYVFIDFWASWCAPCRNENPRVVDAFKRFGQQNIVFVGVSLDKEKALWQKAIINDSLRWAHVSELKGWGCTIARRYGVSSIPANYLVDPQGKIIGINLYGDSLIQQLNRLFIPENTTPES